MSTVTTKFVRKSFGEIILYYPKIYKMKFETIPALERFAQSYGLTLEEIDGEDEDPQRETD